MLEKIFLHPNEGFSQGVLVESTNAKTLYISGQISEEIDLQLQTAAVFKKIEKILQECGATFSDVVKMNTYIVNFNPDTDLPIFRKVRKEFLGANNYPASTLIGVSVLGNRDWLIEIEAIAVVRFDRK